MNRTGVATGPQDRDVLSRWDAGELSMVRLGSCWGCRSGSSGGIETAVKKTGLRGRASRLSERGARQSPTAGWSILFRLQSTDGRTLALIEPSSQADRAFNPITCNAEG
jgi:hypothetical protein